MGFKKKFAVLLKILRLKLKWSAKLCCFPHKIPTIKMMKSFLSYKLAANQ